jgi:rSAM/selenodomain-associated transferase 1
MHYQFPDSLLIIFCKAPVPGQVKTRLTPFLTSQQAANIHKELSIRTINTATLAALCPVQLWCAPSCDHAFFSLITQNYGLSLHQQSGVDLGERMHHAFCCALADYKHAILIGCDCPSLAKNDLQASLNALRNNADIVLAPAEDGGYVLIGINKPQAELFTNIPWGSSEVLATTQQLIAKTNLEYYELDEQWDIDTADDLARYYRLYNDRGNLTQGNAVD